MLQSRYWKIDEFGWLDLERISLDAGTQFIPTDFEEECQTRRVHIKLVTPEHHENNRQVKVKWRMLCTFSHSLMVNARFSEVYIHFALIHTTDHIFRFYQSNIL